VDKETGNEYKTYSIITTNPNDLLAGIHNTKFRQPLIMTDEEATKWIDPTLEKEEIRSLFKIYPETDMEAYTVSRLITAKDKNANVPEILVEHHYPELEYKQGDLFG
jgi:putative SOS response-associated peptidase YedK